MKLKIYRVPASHPCQAVIRGAELKGIEHKVVDLAAADAAASSPTLLFGSRTVPAMKIIGGPNGTEKAQTTLKCLRALESIAAGARLLSRRRRRARARARRRGLGRRRASGPHPSDRLGRACRASRMRCSRFDSNLPLPDAIAKPAGPAVDLG